MPTVQYQNRLRYVRNRPHATVQLLNGNKGTPIPFQNCLVDTGADFTVLPTSAATAVHLAIPSMPSFVGTLGGQVQVHKLVNCTLDVENVAISGVTVLLDPTGHMPTVVGMDALKGLQDFGFNIAEWLWA